LIRKARSRGIAVGRFRDWDSESADPAQAPRRYNARRAARTEYFADQELLRVYAARRLKAALAVEKTLDAGAVDSLVKAAPCASGIFFFHRVGAFFHVAPESEARVRSLLPEGGFKPSRRP
jgi:hypothetical protein